MKVWLDDFRKPPKEGKRNHDWVWVTNAQDCMSVLDTGKVERISLDHDLGWKTQTGYDVVCHIEKLFYEGKPIPNHFSIHSQNPVGARRMLLVLERISQVSRLQLRVDYCPYTSKAGEISENRS